MNRTRVGTPALQQPHTGARGLQLLVQPFVELLVGRPFDAACNPEDFILDVSVGAFLQKFSQFTIHARLKSAERVDILHKAGERSGEDVGAPQSFISANGRSARRYEFESLFKALQFPRAGASS